MPAYNEAANLEQVLASWYPVVTWTGPDSRLVVVDDGSTDETPELLERLRSQMPKLTVLTKPNGGHGAAVRFGYQYALRSGADYVFQTDSDGQTDPAEFWSMWEERRAYDWQIGHRRRRQDGWSRRLVTKVLRAAIFLCCQVGLPDANAPFRLVRAQTLAQCMERIPEDCPLTNVWLAILLKKSGGRGRFCPITFHPRQGGTNSLNMRKIIPIGLRAVRELWALGRACCR